ncbi:hypothetical protein ACLI4A_22390, partial [Pseudomonas aeruginosa]
MSSLLIQAVLAAAETVINRVLRLDGTALPRLPRLSAKVLEVECLSPCPLYTTDAAAAHARSYICSSTVMPIL